MLKRSIAYRLRHLPTGNIITASAKHGEQRERKTTTLIRPWTIERRRSSHQEIYAVGSMDELAQAATITYLIPEANVCDQMLEIDAQQVSNDLRRSFSEDIFSGLS